MTNLEAVQAATKTAAEVLHMEDEIGTVEAGKAADLVLLDGDPVEDIKNLTKVSRVFQAGEEVELPLYDLSDFYKKVHL